MATEPITLKPVRSCLACGGKMRPIYGQLTFERNDMVVTVLDVPISDCSECGERYVPGPVGLEISDVVEGVIRYFSEATKAGAAAQPRSLVMTASERVAKLAAFAT